MPLSRLPFVRLARAAMRAARWYVAGISCASALLLSACAQFTTAQPGPYYPGLGAPGRPTATLAPRGYTVAAWPANSAPGAGEANTIYVAFRHAGSPVPGAAVTLYVQSGGATQPYGPRTTGADGYAAFTLSGAVAQPAHPVLVQVTVTYLGQTYTAATDFTPAP